MIPLPARIHKHWIGYAAITLARACLNGLLRVGLESWVYAPGVNQALVFWIALVAILSVLVITIV